MVNPRARTSFLPLLIRWVFFVVGKANNDLIIHCSQTRAVSLKMYVHAHICCLVWLCSPPISGTTCSLPARGADDLFGGLSVQVLDRASVSNKPALISNLLLLGSGCLCKQRAEAFAATVYTLSNKRSVSVYGSACSLHFFRRGKKKNRFWIRN